VLLIAREAGAVTVRETRRVLAARIRAERKSRQWDVPEMARRLSRAAGDARSALPDHDVLVGYVRRWESARAGVSERFRMLYAGAFGMVEDDLFGEPSASQEGGGGLGLPAGGWTEEDNADLAQMLCGRAVSAASARQIAHEWLVIEPPQVYEVRSGRRIGGRLLTEIEARVERLRQLDDFVGGEDLRDVATAELAATSAVLREASYTERDGRRLLAAFADLCQIGGWIASDAGEQALAERRYLTGVRAAFAAGDRPAAANLLSSLSYQIGAGDPRDAVLLALSARTGAVREATPLMGALLAERAAWAYARLPGGEGSADCERALGAADDAYGSHSTGVAEPPSVYWLDRGEMDVMAGRCYTELARPLKAEPLLVSVLARYDETHAREMALYQTWLAETYVHARELDQAAAVATSALDLSLRVHSARSRSRVQQVRDRLRPYRTSSGAVRAFEDRCRAAEAA
jgi:transcriptional regulator with XRE-family HTH domain